MSDVELLGGIVEDASLDHLLLADYHWQGACTPQVLKDYGGLGVAHALQALNGITVNAKKLWVLTWVLEASQ